MTPEARASFYEAMYRAKCESYDILWREVEKLLEPPAVPEIKCGAAYHVRPGETWICGVAAGHLGAHRMGSREWS